MAIIPNTQKILTLSADVDTTYGGPASLKEQNTWYTMQDIKDSVGGGLPYKVYTAKITTSGTINVSATVLDNTIGNIECTTTTGYDALCALAGAFPSNKTWVSASSSKLPVTDYVTITRLDDGFIQIERYDQYDNPAELIDISIEIRVYN